MRRSAIELALIRQAADDIANQEGGEVAIPVRADVYGVVVYTAEDVSLSAARSMLPLFMQELGLI